MVFEDKSSMYASQSNIIMAETGSDTASEDPVGNPRLKSSLKKTSKYASPAVRRGRRERMSSRDSYDSHDSRASKQSSSRFSAKGSRMESSRYCDLEATEDYSVQWVADEEVAMCMCCQMTEFSIFRRKHHCRACGNVVCDMCSQARVEIIGLTGLQRICEECEYNMINEQKRSSSRLRGSLDEIEITFDSQSFEIESHPQRRGGDKIRSKSSFGDVKANRSQVLRQQRSHSSSSSKRLKNRIRFEDQEKSTKKIAKRSGAELDDLIAAVVANAPNAPHHDLMKQMSKPLKPIAEDKSKQDERNMQAMIASIEAAAPKPVTRALPISVDEKIIATRTEPVSVDEGIPSSTSRAKETDSRQSNQREKDTMVKMILPDAEEEDISTLDQNCVCVFL